MEQVIDKTKILYEVDISTKSYFEYVSRLVDIYSVLYVNEKFWLTEKEKLFFIHSVILYRKGIDLYSLKAVEELDNRMRFKKKGGKGVYVYRGFLKKKNWFAQTKTTLEIPPFFTSVFPDELVFNVNIPKYIKNGNNG